MFFHMKLEHEILLHPKYFGPGIIEAVRAKLFSDVEGSCTGKYGFVVAVTNIDHIGDGRLLPNRGFVQYKIAYRAIVLRPFKGEVIDAVVTQINKIGVFCEAGPFGIFISRCSIPKNVKCEGMGENNDLEGRVDDDDTQIVQVDDRLRVRVMGLRVDANTIFGVGTLMDDYLGPCQ